MECPYCKGARLNKAGKGRRQGQSVQRYWCIDCNRRFSDRAGTPMHRIHKSVEQVERVLKMRSEGLGVRVQNAINFGFLAAFGDPQKKLPPKYLQLVQLARINRLLSKSSPARPNICRFSIFNRLFWPSTCPLLTSSVTPAFTAS
jgi:DNA-directed RNA polymerase subunit RPC12/RpoP